MAGFFDSLASGKIKEKIDLNPPQKKANESAQATIDAAAARKKKDEENDELEEMEKEEETEKEEDVNRECVREGNRKLVLELAGKFRKIAKILEQLEF